MAKWYVIMRSSVLHGVTVNAKNADDAQTKVENAFLKDDRDPTHRSISLSLDVPDEIEETDVIDVVREK